MLVACACGALIVANSAWADAYHRLLATTIAIAAGGHELSLTVHQWINDGFMAVFFLLVGLEIKREAIAGELASPRQAALPIAAAIGGMVVPALIYLLTSSGGVPCEFLMVNSRLVRIFLGESDRWKHRPLLAGFGASSVIHTTSLLELSSDLPVLIEVVDDDARIERLLPILDEMITGGALVTMERVRVLKYAAGHNRQ